MQITEAVVQGHKTTVLRANGRASRVRFDDYAGPKNPWVVDTSEEDGWNAQGAWPTRKAALDEAEAELGR